MTTWDETLEADCTVFVTTLLWFWLNGRRSVMTGFLYAKSVLMSENVDLLGVDFQQELSRRFLGGM